MSMNFTEIHGDRFCVELDARTWLRDHAALEERGFVLILAGKPVAWFREKPEVHIVAEDTALWDADNNAFWIQVPLGQKLVWGVVA